MTKENQDDVKLEVKEAPVEAPVIPDTPEIAEVPAPRVKRTKHWDLGG